jgi:hypothetical protein
VVSPPGWVEAEGDPVHRRDYLEPDA